MAIRLGSRRVRTPSGTEWRVGRRWTSRGLPRWRRLHLGQAADRAAEKAWFVPVDVGSLDDLGLLLGGILVAIVIAVVVIPLLHSGSSS